jgi:PAS domain S-box-containing protein/putative nucleotidyltransferase with HDIG domain
MNQNSVQTKKSGVAVQSGKTNEQNQKVVVVSELSNKQSAKSTLKKLFFLDIVETIREPLLVLDVDLRVLYANRSFYKTFKIAARATIGNLIYDLGNKQWDIPKLRILLEEIIPEHIRFSGYQVEHEFPSIGKRIMLLNARRIAKPLEMQQFILLAIEDVTDRIRIEQVMQASEERFRRAFETAKDGMLLIDKISGRILNSNQASQDLLGYSIKDFQKQKIWKIGFIRDVEQFHIASNQLEDKGFIDFVDTSVIARDGREISADVFMMDKAKVFQCNIRDIKERKQAEKTLQKSEEKFKRMVMTSSQGIWMTDAQMKIIFANARMAEILGYAVDELIDHKSSDFMFDEDLRDHNLRMKSRMEGVAESYERRLKHKNGSAVWTMISASPLFNAKGKFEGTIAMMADITENKRVFEALGESQERFSSAFKFSSIGMSLVGLDGNFLQVNRAFCEIVGYSEKELLQRTFQEITHPDDLEADLGYVHQMLAGEITTYQMEKRYIHKLGQIIWVLLSVSLVHDKESKPLYFLSQIQDITKRKRSEQLLNIRNQVAISLGTAETLEEIFTLVSNQLKKLNLACMLFPLDQGRNRIITKYLSLDSSTLNIAEKMVGIKHENFSFSVDAFDDYKQVIREKKTVYQENTTALLHQVLPAPFKKLALPITKMLNIPKTIISPLTIREDVMGAFLVLSNDLSDEDVPAVTAFADQLAAAWYKTELLQNLKIGLQERDQAQSELKANFNRIQKSLVDIINAMTFIVEKRDPYTAGHQERVTKLATAIAIELHLSEDQINAIRTSGLLHDIGKINIPAEILSKPGKLTPDEFRLLKSHPKNGFDILKKIDFPWPVAEIVYQHHERINGIGYPRHLKGDKICIEAKILGVADVVEAMLSHRPYRAALGKEVTLKEITDNKNILYDEKVVNACVKIFKTGKFKF